MKDLQRDSIDFGTTSIAPLFRRIFYPTLLSMVFGSILTVVDGIFVGRGVGSDALAAVNIVAPLFMVCTGLGLMFGVGASVVASIHLSKGNVKAANINITQALEASVLLMGVISAVLYLVGIPFLRLMGCSDVLLPYALDYMVYLLPGFVFMIVQMVGTFIIRLDSSPAFASLVGIVPGTLNILLDWYLVFPCQMGIKGSSIATTVCCGIAAAMVVFYMFRRTKTLSLYRVKYTRTGLYLTLRNLGYMARSGFSSMLGELTMSVIMVTGNYVFIRSLGEDGVAAFSVACYLYPIVFMVNNSVAQSAQPIISYNYGAGSAVRVGEALRFSVRTALICGVLETAFLFFFAPFLVGLFLREGTVPHSYAVTGIPLFSLSAVFFAVNIALIGYYQAVEKNGKATVYMFLRGLVFLVPSFVMLPMAASPQGMWLAVPLSECLTLISIILTGGWRKGTFQGRKKGEQPA